MEPPFLVLRHGGVATTMPILELFAMQKAARMLVWQVLQGDPGAKYKFEELRRLASDPSNPTQAHATISMYILQDAFEDAKQAREAEMQRQRQQPPPQSPPQQQAQPPGPPPPQAPPRPPPRAPGPPGPPGAENFCAHGLPNDLPGMPCPQCEHGRQVAAAAAGAAQNGAPA